MTDKKVSNLLESQFPSFVRKDGENLLEFVRAYYEWMEQEGEAVHETKTFLENRDVDDSADSFINFFMSEVASSFPSEVLTDKRKLAKQIKDFYLSKGSERSYRLLFRILYDQEIEFFYPGESILRVSDGRWLEESSLRTSIRVTGPFAGNPANLGGRNIIGQTSGASAQVTRVVKRNEIGISVFELFITDQIGTFDEEETIATPEGDISADITVTVGPIESVKVDAGTIGWTVGDAVNYVATDGSGANGSVTEINSSGVNFIIVDGGSGYTNSATITYGASSGEGASFEITSISNTEAILTYDDIIRCMSNVEILADPFGSGANSCPISSNLASANLSSNIGSSLGTSNNLYGTINSIATTNVGTGYGLLLPTVEVRENPTANLEIDDGEGGIKGFNAEIETELLSEEGDTGKLISVDVNSGGQGYLPLQLSITNQTNTAVPTSLGTPAITGIVNYPGKYVDTKGWLSWNNRLQDNFYYQEFSYELITNEFIEAYKKLVERLSHPAGTKLFGRVRIYNEVSANNRTLSIEDETQVN